MDSGLETQTGHSSYLQEHSLENRILEHILEIKVLESVDPKMHFKIQES